MAIVAKINNTILSWFRLSFDELIIHKSILGFKLVLRRPSTKASLHEHSYVQM